MRRSFDPSLPGLIWDIISEGYDIGFALPLYGAVHIAPFWETLDRMATTYHLRVMWIGLQKAVDMGIPLERILAVCHLLWQQPCFPQKGSLSLAEDNVGLLTMSPE